MSHEIEIVSKRLEQSSGAGAIAPPMPLPPPRVPIEIRVATMSDLPFIDSLQKKQTKNVGWFPTKAIEGKISAGHVLMAEENRGSGFGVRVSGEENDVVNGALPALNPIPDTRHPNPVAYLIGADQYFKRDDVGIIYQINVAPGRQRGLIGAALVKAQFERSAYGCRLYCCWCAQDIEANRFWEAMGFVPLAFRVGSEQRGKNGEARVHIFWQKRIRSGDTATPWWFPSKTAGGSIREDRIVLPIPPGMHWSDAKPLILPAAELPGGSAQLPVPSEQLPVEKKKGRESKKPKPVGTPAAFRRNGLYFDIPRQGEPLPETKLAKQATPNPPRVKRTCDPRLVSAARELRDRWLEQVNSMPLSAHGKYDVSRLNGKTVHFQVGNLPSVANGSAKLLSAA